jgi:hypothetical protein
MVRAFDEPGTVRTVGFSEEPAEILEKQANAAIR